MTDELIEKCRLTPLEIEIAIESSYDWDAVEIIPTEKGTQECELKEHQSIANAATVKAIPLISAEARKQERERIINWLAKYVYENYSDVMVLKIPRREWRDAETGYQTLGAIRRLRQALKEGGKEAK